MGAIVLVAALLQSTAGAATSSSVVSVTVPSATNLSILPGGAPPNGCQTGTANVTSFGNVLPGASAITADDCNVVWGSSNASAMLRLYQADGGGRAMQSPLCEAVVACYTFENSLVDGSPTGNDMTAAANPADPSYQPGRRAYERALDFDGSDEATIPYHASHDLDVYTVEFWMNGKGLDGGTQQLLGKRSDFATPWTDALRNFVIQRQAGNSMQASITHSGGTRQDVSGGLAGFDTGWHHVALVSQGGGGKLQLFLDGTNVSEVTIGGNVDNPAEPIYVGHRPNGGSYSSNALIDDLRIHARALTGGEIAGIIGDTGGPADYDDDNIGLDHNWSEGANMFGACLETATNGAVGGAGVGGWAVAGNDNCTAASPAWNPIVATSGTAGSKVAAVTPGPDADAAVTLRFGFRTANDQKPGTYVAPLVFEVVAPYV